MDTFDTNEVLEQNERIGDRVLTLTPFSCEHKNYKIFEGQLNNFDAFIKANVEKEKPEGLFSIFKDKITGFFVNDDDIQNIKENLKKYMKIENIDKFHSDKKEFLSYLNNLKKLFIKNEKKGYRNNC